MSAAEFVMPTAGARAAARFIPSDSCGLSDVDGLWQALNMSGIANAQMICFLFMIDFTQGTRK
jgi:hypothetical protein